MSNADEQWWVRARAARDKLAASVLQHPQVSLIAVGEDPRRESGTPVLRVHVRSDAPADLEIPDSVDGIPVRVVRGDYHLE